MLIDFHTHCFPDNLAPKVIPKLSDASGGLEPFTDGTVAGLKKSMENNNIEASVVLNIATNPHQQTKVNDFAASINDNKNIFSFGSVHFESPDVFDELERIKAMGLKGIKLHPDYQGFEADDPKMKPIYQKISSLGLICVFHSGRDHGFKPPYNNTPEKMLKAFSWFSSPVIAAHWGGVGCYEDVLNLLAGSDVFFDTSFGYSMMPKYFAQKILDKHGADKMVFGTDTPWHTAKMEMRLLDSLDISQSDKEKIFYKNACALLGI